MAFRNLVESQCGDANPLMKVTQHVSRDIAHRQDGMRWVQPSQKEMQGNFGPDMALSPDLLVNEFMENSLQPMSAAPQTFRMDTLLQEMNEIEGVAHKNPPTLGPKVAHLAGQPSTWAHEFLNSDHVSQQLPMSYTYNQMPGLPTTLSYQRNWSQDMNLDDLSGKPLEASKPIEDNPELAKTANKLLEAVDDPKFTNTEFMKYVRDLAGKENESEANRLWANSFMHLPSHETQQFPSLQPVQNIVEDIQSNPEMFDDVQIDSEEMTESEREDFWKDFQNKWTEHSKESARSWESEFISDEPFQDYKFEENNPLKDHPDPLTEGKRYLKLGLLPFAILHFEAACQQQPDNVEAWLFLGKTHAENEQDVSAIRALKKCVSLDKTLTEAWMALATCYANESYQSLACTALKEWILNSEYKHLVTSETEENTSTFGTLASKELLEEVKSLYIEAANVNAGKIDPKVQCGLGILLNIMGEYSKAIDCFQAALSEDNTNAKLWNKLGATLANSERSAEAVEAYSKALDLEPGFIRCRYNLGIACINLNAHQQALEHFLTALNMQEKASINGVKSSLPVSDGIWSTVKLCLTRLGRYDLHKVAVERDLELLNKEFHCDSK